MHTYPDYHAPDPRAAVDFVRSHPFAVMVSNGDRHPLATHVVTVPAPGVELGDQLVGSTFWTHVGRANRHWRVVKEQPEVLFVHTSSHGYVSPTQYRREPAVPTVDYAAVHLEATLTVWEEPRRVLDVVEHTTTWLEARRDPPWDMTNSLETFERIAPMVVAFEVTITDAQAVFKLSQDMEAPIQQRLRAEFGAPGCPHADLARLMGQMPTEHIRGEHFPPVIEGP